MHFLDFYSVAFLANGLHVSDILIHHKRKAKLNHTKGDNTLPSKRKGIMPRYSTARMPFTQKPSTEATKNREVP